MEDYQEFLNKLQKRGSKPHKLSHCLGTRDAWKWVRRNKWEALDGKPCDKLLYSRIINIVNQLLIESLLDGHAVEFPYQLGKLLIESIPAKVWYKDGELMTNYRTDWKKTLEYWYENEEARNTHKPIKRVQKNFYYIRYDKKQAHFTNRKFYFFRPNRSLVKKLGAAGESGKIYAAELEKEY